MKNDYSKNADVEIAIGVGATAAALTGAGVITSGGVVSGMVAELGAATGLSAIADIGAGIATVCGALGPVGWAAAGLAGV